MNNEFEWRNQMRKLGGPVQPERDLWPAIASRISAQPLAVPRRRSLVWLAVAAALVAVVGTGLVLQQNRSISPVVVAPSRAPAPDPNASAAAPPTTPSAELPHTALDWAVPDDPRLAATAQNLDNASAQLQDALEQRPDAVFLVGLLNRTNAMRLRLMRKSPYAD